VEFEAPVTSNSSCSDSSDVQGFAHNVNEESFAAALAALGIGRRTLRNLLDGSSPRQAWEQIVAGGCPFDPGRVLHNDALPGMPSEFEHRLRSCSVGTLVFGTQAFPDCLANDIDSPAVVFCLGNPQVLSGHPRVAVVGTRAATRYGLDVASELGAGLASAGVTVVSGLAAGIDSASHAGAVSTNHGAPPIAVIATAIDVAYPRSSAALRDAVSARGVVLSELPPGVQSERWRFADRNRVMAALAHVVVVVECHKHGGALYTVDAARERGIDILAVPGSVRSPASSGTNSLLADGVPPARDVEDVLAALELALAGDESVKALEWPKNHCVGESSKPPSEVSARVLAALEYEPSSLEQVVVRSRAHLGEVALALEQLVDLELADGENGWWWRRGRR
jgi:DNA processing protein